MLCWVLGSLVLPTVSLLGPGVSASEGVVAWGFGVGGGAGVGVVVPGPGFGRGWLGVAWGGRLPLLNEGLVGPPLCPSGVSGGPATPLAGGCWVLVLWVFVCCVRLWCGQCLCFGVWCVFVGLVLVAVVAVCVVCMRGRVCGVLVVRLGACPRLSGLGLAVLCGCEGCVWWHSHSHSHSHIYIYTYIYSHSHSHSHNHLSCRLPRGLPRDPQCTRPRCGEGPTYLVTTQVHLYGAGTNGRPVQQSYTLTGSACIGPPVGKLMEGGTRASVGRPPSPNPAWQQAHQQPRGTPRGQNREQRNTEGKGGGCARGVGNCVVQRLVHR